jgi:hypothetical protein
MKDEIMKKDEKMKILQPHLKEIKIANSDERSYNKLFVFYFLFQFLV